VYSIINQDLELLQEAKAAGLKIVHDHILSPDVGLILREERARFPGIERQDREEWVWRGIERDRAQWALADLVLAPAEHSQQAIRELGGDAARIERVPYGVSERWLETQPMPEPGRVLFVGSVGLRKGTHYLAAAARRLKARGVPCEVVVAGPFDPQAIERPEFHGPTYLGSIPRSEVQDAFLRADLFVHPSLAEGCPIASLEALACGLPIVATPNAGTVIADGEAGFLVPIRDAEALADRIERLVTDRALRQQMSNAAREQARTVTWSAYRERLVQAIESHLGEIDDDIL
jgi:glycosyltransferase involved in cell wall biosynthesis